MRQAVAGHQYFQKRFVNDLTVAWNDELEVCPDGLYENGITYNQWLEQQKKQ